MSNRDYLTLSLLAPGADNGSLLERLLALGLAVPYGCRNGNCWSCRARLLAGNVSAGEVTVTPLASDEILLCRSRPRGPVTLALGCGEALQALPCERGDYPPDPGRSTLVLRWAAGRRRLPQRGQIVSLVAGGPPVAARIAAVDADSRLLTVTFDAAQPIAAGVTATVYFAAR